MQPIREDIRGRDLPENLRRKAKVAADEIVTITIHPRLSAALENTLDILDRAGEKAKQRGLTGEVLADLLKDES